MALTWQFREVIERGDKMHRPRRDWHTLLNSLGILWIHDQNPKRPHAELTSGLHSNGFFNGSKLLNDYPRIARQLCEDFVEFDVLPYIGGEKIPHIDRVIGPAFGAITLADKIADALDTAAGFMLPVGSGDEKTFVLEKRFNINGKYVLGVEDTITTGGSIQKMIDVAEAPSEDGRTGAIVAPFILAICNRSNMREINGRPILAFIDKPMPTWTASKCPYCAKGSVALRPKEAQNWEKLSDRY
jgi:orotate phosphoribosyltransferase